MEQAGVEACLHGFMLSWAFLRPLMRKCSSSRVRLPFFDEAVEPRDLWSLVLRCSISSGWRKGSKGKRSAQPVFGTTDGSSCPRVMRLGRWTGRQGRRESVQVWKLRFIQESVKILYIRLTMAALELYWVSSRWYPEAASSSASAPARKKAREADGRRAPCARIRSRAGGRGQSGARAAPARYARPRRYRRARDTRESGSRRLGNRAAGRTERSGTKRDEGTTCRIVKPGPRRSGARKSPGPACGERRGEGSAAVQPGETLPAERTGPPRRRVREAGAAVFMPKTAAGYTP